MSFANLKTGDGFDSGASTKRSEISPRERITRSPVKNVSGLKPWGLFLFGVPFVLIGTVLIATHLDWSAAAGKRMDFPFWVPPLSGAIFAMGGFGVWAMALRDIWEQRRLKNSAQQYGSEPALRDYPWNVQSSSNPRWKPFGQALAATCALGLFLSIFNWFAFFDKDSPLFVKGVVSLFDFILLFMVWNTAKCLVRGLKFGPARLEWAGFPQNPKAVSLRWVPGRGMEGWEKATFTLRCIQETHRLVQTQKGKRNQVSHEGLWHQSSLFGSRSSHALAGPIDLHFSAPESVPGSLLSGVDPIFWELEVVLEVPGINFEHRYLVPVYR